MMQLQHGTSVIMGATPKPLTGYCQRVISMICAYILAMATGIGVQCRGGGGTAVAKLTKFIKLNNTTT